MKVYFSALLGSAIVLALSGAVLAWDGSYLFYRTIGIDVPYIPNFRYIILPAHLMVIFFSNFIDNLYILQVIFSGLYAIIPLLSMVLSWYIIRDERPELFIWSVIGNGLIVICGQFFLVSEAILVLYLFWPLWFAVIVGGTSWRKIVIVVFALLLPFTHSFTVGLLAYALVSWFIFHYRHKSLKSSSSLLIAVVLMIGIVITIATVLLDTDPYVVSSSLSLRIILSAFYHLNILIIINLILVGIISLLLFLWQLKHRQGLSQKSSKIPRIIMGLIVVCGISLFLWAADPHAWWNELGFRTVAVFVISPIYFLSFLDSIFAEKYPNQSIKDIPLHNNLISMVGIIFIVVIVTHSLSWIDVTNRLQAMIDQESSPCIAMESIEDNLTQTVFDYWSLMPYVLIMQGNKPQYIVQEEANCTSELLSDGIYITEWDRYLWGQDLRWFNFEELHTNLNQAFIES